MSKFATKILVNTEGVKQMLPKGALVHEASYDKDAQAVIVKWEHGQLHTGFSFPVEFTQNQLGAGIVPDGVHDLRPSVADAQREIEVTQSVADEPQPVEIEKPKRKKANA